MHRYVLIMATAFTLSIAILRGSCPMASDASAPALEVLPEKAARGEAVLLKISCPEPLSTVKGDWYGKELRFYRDRAGGNFFSLLGIDMEARPGVSAIHLDILTSKGSAFRKSFSLTVLDKAFKIQRLSLPSKMVSLNSKDLARVKKEKAAVSRLFESMAKEKAWDEKFILPVTGPILSPFGSRRIINDEPRSPHSGVDIRAKEDAPVLASSDGLVVMTAEHFFAGKSVYIDHGMGIITMYFHLSEILVKEGQEVSLGQLIGKVGHTGRATGPHLHWGVRIQGNRVDPISLVRLFK